MAVNDYVKFVTQRFVTYMDMPKEERRGGGARANKSGRRSLTACSASCRFHSVCCFGAARNGRPLACSRRAFLMERDGGIRAGLRLQAFRTAAHDVRGSK